MLWIGTGDARSPDTSEDPSTLNGKILRVTLDGEPPPDNPTPGSIVWARGLRNVEAFGSFLVGTLLSQHLHRVVLDPNDPKRVVLHEAHLAGVLGRMRDVAMSPDGELYVTTSNCDGRGTCPPDKDRIVRITR